MDVSLFISMEIMSQAPPPLFDMIIGISILKTDLMCFLLVIPAFLELP